MTNIINHQIREKEVLVIDQNGNNRGLLATADALAMAERADMDLVVMQDKNKPFVCKIMDYNRALYEQKKREKERKKSQKIIEIKTIQLSSNIDIGDFARKTEKAREELLEGNKILVSLRLRGRENAHPQLGVATVNRFCDALSNIGTVTKAPKLDSRVITAMIEKRKEK